jgi:RTX calcium-binding nonapeptide repeat (4 copies)
MLGRLTLLTATILLGLAAPALAAPVTAVTIGSPLSLAPDPAGFAPSGEVQALQAPVDSPEAVPYDGVLTRWHLRSLPTAGDTVLQVLRPETDGDETTFTVVAESAPVHVTSTAITAVPAQLPVKAGDRIAARSVEADGGASDLGAIAAHAGATLLTQQPPKMLHQTWTPPADATSAYELLVQADLEPDVDQDGKGDLTQDSADLVLTGSAPSNVPALKDWSMSYTVRNDGPDAALGVVLEVTGNAVTPGPTTGALKCSVDVDVTSRFVCRLAELGVGESVSVAPSFPSPAIGGVTFGATFATQATVIATTRDPDISDNAAALKVVVPASPPYVPNIPPPPALVIKPCTNIIRGTRDDDVVRGTAFGDRLVGGDGDDLLKGQGADDCLEGGTGDDVLDGGDGNDRLAGSAGRDRLSGGTGDDKLTGGKGNDRLTGGPGNDTISPGSGRDAIDAGAGNDTINSVDGVKEAIDCGAGRDTIRADKRDTLKHCEKVTRR